jgi:hypothetical protein
MSAKDIIMGQVFPIVGGILSTIMYCSPVKATYTARKNNALGVSAPAEGGKAEHSVLEPDQQPARLKQAFTQSFAVLKQASLPLPLVCRDCF